MSDAASQKRIFLASFMTLIAAGIGFGIRGAVLADWAGQFGFTKTDLGTITGGGLTGFGFTIIFFSLFADKFGYRALMLGAFVLHVLSALVTLAATPIFASSAGKDGAYWCLYVGMFMFSLANGLCETVINPLTATLYPKQKTHYLNILHAGWPGGLILGGLLAYCFVGDDAAVTRLRWEIPMLFFLAPTVWYGLVTLMEKFPISEARAAGLTFMDMLKEFAAPMLLFLLLIHAMVGYVELGTDSWITNIMKNVIQGKELLLFIYTSAIMFVLRFFAGPIVERINPLGLLCLSACLGCTGLYCLGSSSTGLAIVLSATIYGLGKTFLWPTMLGVVGERFPRGGALTMGTMGGIGMLSAGLLGGPGIGYTQDYFAAENLRESSPSVFEKFVSPEKNSFLFFPKISGLDGQKVEATPDSDPDSKLVKDAGIFGGRMALKVTAMIPATMAICYLLLILYFRAIGGYKAVEITGGTAHESSFSPSAEDAIELGTEGPGQA
jgi:MFS family permease